MRPSGSARSWHGHIYHRGNTYEKMGDKTKAEEDFAEAKRLGYKPK